MGNFFEKLKKGMGIEIPKEKEGVEISVKKIEKNLPEPEGELAVDVWQTKDELIVQAPIAGVKPEDLNITLEDDVLIIEGERKKPSLEEGDYFLQECYWGKFSRKIILPIEIDSGKIQATFKDGILTIRLPKIQKMQKKKIIVKAG